MVVAGRWFSNSITDAPIYITWLAEQRIRPYLSIIINVMKGRWSNV
jgi:hypothetical protein